MKETCGNGHVLAEVGVRTWTGVVATGRVRTIRKCIACQNEANARRRQKEAAERNRSKVSSKEAGRRRYRELTGEPLERFMDLGVEAETASVLRKEEIRQERARIWEEHCG